MITDEPMRLSCQAILDRKEKLYSTEYCMNRLGEYDPEMTVIIQPTSPEVRRRMVYFLNCVFDGFPVVFQEEAAEPMNVVFIGGISRCHSSTYNIFPCRLGQASSIDYQNKSHDDLVEAATSYQDGKKLAAVEIGMNLLHELGHIWGLEHNNSPGTIMYRSMSAHPASSRHAYTESELLTLVHNLGSAEHLLSGSSLEELIHRPQECIHIPEDLDRQKANDDPQVGP